MDTFALGFALNAFAGKVGKFDLPTQLLLFSSLSLLMLSVAFCIFALLPRSITFPHVGEPIMKIRMSEYEQPLAISNGIGKLPEDKRNEEWHKYVAKSFGTLDARIGLIERIFDLRAMVYAKIEWINRSVVAFLAGLGMLIPLAFAGFFWVQAVSTPILVLLGLFLYLRTRFVGKSSSASRTPSGN